MLRRPKEDSIKQIGYFKTKINLKECYLGTMKYWKDPNIKDCAPVPDNAKTVYECVSEFMPNHKNRISFHGYGILNQEQVYKWIMEGRVKMEEKKTKAYIYPVHNGELVYFFPDWETFEDDMCRRDARFKLNGEEKHKRYYKK